MEPKHSITDGNIHKKARPKSAIITTIPTSTTNELSNKYTTNKIDGYKRPVVEYGLVKQRAKVSPSTLHNITFYSIFYTYYKYVVIQLLQYYIQ